MLSQIAKTFFGASPVLGYPVIAMLIFLAVFLVVSVRALRKDRSEIDQLAKIPFEGEEPS